MPSKPNPQKELIEALRAHTDQLAAYRKDLEGLGVKLQALRESIDDSTATELALNETLQALMQANPAVGAAVTDALTGSAAESDAGTKATPAEPEQEPSTEDDGDQAEADEAPAGEDQRELPDPDELDAAPAATTEQRAAATRDTADFKGVAVVGSDFVQIGAERRQLAVRSTAQMLKIAVNQLEAPQGSSSVRQVWLLAEPCIELGLRITEEEPPGLTDEGLRDWEFAKLAELGKALIEDAAGDGWTAVRGDKPTGLEPRTLFKRGTDKSAELIELVLEPYQYLYDDTDVSFVGTPQRGTELSEEAGERADQIIERCKWWAEHFAVLPRGSAGMTMQQHVGQTRRSKIRKLARGGATQDRLGRKRDRLVDEPGDMPKEFRPLRGEVEPQSSWYRPGGPFDEEIEQADVLLALDQRRAYPASTSNLLLGLGALEWVEADEARQAAQDLLRKGEADKAIGFWRCENYDAWPEARLPAPHPAMNYQGSDDTKPVMWPSYSTLEIALTDWDDNGAGLDVDALGITGAYLYPDAGRLMEPWNAAYRAAFRAVEEMPPGELRTWASDVLQLGGRSVIGRMARLPATVKDPMHLYQPWTYQPMWLQQIIAATRARLLRQLITIARKYNVWPVQTAVDAAVYLLPRHIAEELCAADNATDKDGKPVKRLGVLRQEAWRDLTDEDKQRLRQRRHEPVTRVLPLTKGDKE